MDEVEEVEEDEMANKVKEQDAQLIILEVALKKSEVDRRKMELSLAREHTSCGEVMADLRLSDSMNQSLETELRMERARLKDLRNALDKELRQKSSLEGQNLALQQRVKVLEEKLSRTIWGKIKRSWEVLGKIYQPLRPN